jgi:L-ribulose-5-phosphate 4-epimerase
VNSVALEQVARMALASLQLAPALPVIPGMLLEKHYLRKHGTAAYYGQK